MKKKIIAIALCAALAVGGVVAGSLAFLQDTTGPVVNTFTYGDINITLAETDNNVDGDNDSNTNTYKMIPGEDIAKDPKVTVLADSENCWLFVEVDESASYGDYLADYAMADGWIELEEGVYYREVTANTADQVFEVLEGNKVTVLEDVTKADMEALKNGNTAAPTLTFKAYAVQKDGFDTAAAAWTQAQIDA